MTKFREILRLHSLEFSQQNIAYSYNVSKKTVNRVIKRAKELNLFWLLDETQIDAVLEGIFFPQKISVPILPSVCLIFLTFAKNY